MFVVLAAAQPDEVEAFVKCLYVVIAGLSSDAIPKKLAQDMQAWLKKAQRVENELGVDMLKDIVRYAKTGELDEVKFAMLAKAMRISLKKGEIQRDPHIPHHLTDALMAASSYIIAQSPNQLKKLIKLASELNEPNIMSAFVVDVEDQKSFVKPLQKIVKAATGSQGTQLTAEQIKDLKGKYPKLHKEYLGLRKGFNEAWKTAMRNYVYDSGKKALPFQQVIDYLNGQGLQHTLPKGNFKGLIDGNGKLYTMAGKAIKGAPGFGFHIEMNPNYDPKKDDQYVFTTVNSETGDKSQHVYTVSFNKQRTAEKFEKVSALMADIHKIQKKWTPYVRKADRSPQCVASAMLEIIAQYSARIGSMGNSAGGKATQGLSTLMVKNVKIKGNNYALDYLGKDGVRQIHLIEGSTTKGKILIKDLQAFMDGKEPTDFLFTYEWNGKAKRMTGDMVNKWFAKMGAPEGVTVHKLRHVKGTEIFAEVLKKHEDKIFNSSKQMSQAEADRMLKALATEVGKQLGHVKGVGKQQKVVGTTAIQNYIAPELMVGYYVRLGLRPPKFLAKFL